ncbi:UNVERIFIED_CONTAM: hypothetical protein ABID98_000284 [Brevibacillus sp. OAP136]
MRYALVLIPTLLLAACSDVSQGVQEATTSVQQAIDTGKQAVEVGKQAVETGKQVVQKGKEIADSELAKQLQSFLQQKYESSAALRAAMFSGDGKLVAAELKKTELADFSFYKSDLLGLEFKGKLTADGTFQVLRYDLANAQAAPTVVKEFNVLLGKDGQIQVQ